MEEIYLPEDGPTELDANVSIADAEWAEQEARRADTHSQGWYSGRMDRGTRTGVGYAVVWRKGRRWAGKKVHMGFFQEAYDAECAAIVRALAVAGKDQRAELWARVKEATKRAKRKWRVGYLLADVRCSPAVLDFLRSTYVGRAAPPVEETWDSGGEGDGAVGEGPEAEGGRGLAE